MGEILDTTATLFLEMNISIFKSEFNCNSQP